MLIYYEDGALNVGAKASQRREFVMTDAHRGAPPSPSWGRSKAGIYRHHHAVDDGINPGDGENSDFVV